MDARPRPATGEFETQGDMGNELTKSNDEENHRKTADNMLPRYPNELKPALVILKQCVFSCHVEYVYDHRHLLLEGASRGSC